MLNASLMAAPLHDLIVWIFSSSTTMEIRCVMSPASLKTFILACCAARARPRWAP